MKLAEQPGALLVGQLEECILGDHEGCPGEKDGWRDAHDQEGTRFIRRCSCGCHRLDPWPWPTAEDHPVLLLMASLERSLAEAGCDIRAKSFSGDVTP